MTAEYVRDPLHSGRREDTPAGPRRAQRYPSDAGEVRGLRDQAGLVVPAGRLVSHPEGGPLPAPLMRRSQAGSTFVDQPHESLRPRVREEESAAVAASVVVFSSRGMAALRTTLHSVWSEVSEAQLIVMTESRDAEVAEYLLRQYRRGRIAGLGVASGPPAGDALRPRSRGASCGGVDGSVCREGQR